jgi:hypothetical protein
MLLFGYPYYLHKIAFSLFKVIKQLLVLPTKHIALKITEPLLWSSVQSSGLLNQRSRVRFLAPPNFLRNSESGKGSTQTREDK